MRITKKHLLILCVMCLGACRTMVNMESMDFSHLYHPDAQELRPQYHLTHTSRDTSTLTMHIPATQLLYQRGRAEDFHIARYQLTWMTFDSFGRSTLLDSTRVQFTDTLVLDQDHMLRHEVKIPLPDDYKTLLLLEFRDLNRRIHHTQPIRVDKRFPYDARYFTIREGDDSLSVPFCLPINQDLHLIYFDSMDFELTVHHYIPTGQFPTAPYVLEETPEALPLHPDSSFTIGFYRGVSGLNLPQHGLYRFFDADVPESGFLSYSFHQDFPYITQAENMLLPLRYITSRQEFEDILKLGDARLAAERFWTRSTGNPDRAHTVMTRYYHRVEDANIHFSSHLPGWQTDRGMIFIVLGPPDLVYQTSETETWYYDEKMGKAPAEFVFKKIKHMYSDNHYVLVRNARYRSSWNRAVHQWRR